MKLRIQNDSIRLRLTRSEIDELQSGGLVSASTHFPGGMALRYSVESSPAAVTLSASFSDNAVLVSIPETQVLGWAGSEQVGLEEQQLLAGGDRLHVLVEKDFHCLSPRAGEDESDMFPHPEADSGHSC